MDQPVLGCLFDHTFNIGVGKTIGELCQRRHLLFRQCYGQTAGQILADGLPAFLRIGQVNEKDLGKSAFAE